MLILKTIPISHLIKETPVQVTEMNWYPTEKQNRPIEVSIQTKVINLQVDLFKNLRRTLRKGLIPNQVQGLLRQNRVPGRLTQNQVQNQVPSHPTQSRVQGLAPSRAHDHQIPDPVPSLLVPGRVPDLQQPEELHLEIVIQEQDINNIFNFLSINLKWK